MNSTLSSKFLEGCTSGIPDRSLILFRGSFWRLWALSNICCYTFVFISLWEGLELHFPRSWQMLLFVSVVGLPVRWVKTWPLVCSAVKHKDLAEASGVCWEWLWGLRCSDDFVSRPWALCAPANPFLSLAAVPGVANQMTSVDSHWSLQNLVLKKRLVRAK